MLRLDARFRASLEKPGQSLVLETADHASECNACGYELQDARRSRPPARGCDVCQRRGVSRASEWGVGLGIAKCRKPCFPHRADGASDNLCFFGRKHIALRHIADEARKGEITSLIWPRRYDAIDVPSDTVATTSLDLEAFQLGNRRAASRLVRVERRVRAHFA
jgi:hypothetical protein